MSRRVIEAEPGTAPGGDIFGVDRGLVSMENTLQINVASVLPDEPCLSIQEYNLLNREGTRRHRYQIVQVVRRDRVCTCYTDLGCFPSLLAKHEFSIPAGFRDRRTQKIYSFHTVADMQYRAVHHRERFQLPDLEEEAMSLYDFNEMWHDHTYERWLKENRISSFGPGGIFQR